MKSSRVWLLAGLISGLLFLTGCVSNYYDRFGGYPLQTDDLNLKIGSFPIKLQVTYRFPYQMDMPDSTALNLTVKVIVAKEILADVQVEKLTLAAKDGSYLLSYDNPAVYDINGNYPIRSLIRQDSNDYTFSNSDQISIFHVLRESHLFDLTLDCKIKQPDRSWQTKSRSLPLDISGVTHKVGIDNPVFMQE